MNKRLPIIVFILAITVILLYIVTTLGQSKEIKAVGYGTIYNNNKSTARDKAIEDAQRKAVEQAMGTMISSETLMKNFQLINDRILSLASGYIETYTVISQKEADNEMIVEILAVVGTHKLNDSIQAIKNLIRRMGKPKMMILIAEQSIYEEGQTSAQKTSGQVVLSATSLGVAENALIEFFRAKGFEFIDRQAIAGQIEVADPIMLVNDQERVKRIANLTDAQVVIFGQAQARVGGQVHDIYSGQANISLRALKADTGEIIAASNEHTAVPFVDPSTANSKALSEAAKKISQKLMDQILKQWQSEASGIRNVFLVIKGANYAEIKQFRSWLPKYVRGVKSVNQRDVQDGVAELEIEIQGSAQDLADSLSEKVFLEKTIEVLSLSSNKVGVEMK